MSDWNTPGLALTGISIAQIRPGNAALWKAATVPGLTTGETVNQTLQTEARA